MSLSLAVQAALLQGRTRTPTVTPPPTLSLTLSS